MGVLRKYTYNPNNNPCFPPKVGPSTTIQTPTPDKINAPEGPWLVLWLPYFCILAGLAPGFNARKLPSPQSQPFLPKKIRIFRFLVYSCGTAEVFMYCFVCLQQWGTLHTVCDRSCAHDAPSVRISGRSMRDRISCFFFVKDHPQAQPRVRLRLKRGLKLETESIPFFLLIFLVECGTPEFFFWIVWKTALVHKRAIVVSDRAHMWGDVPPSWVVHSRAMRCAHRSGTGLQTPVVSWNMYFLKVENWMDLKECGKITFLGFLVSWGRKIHRFTSDPAPGKCHLSPYSLTCHKTDLSPTSVLAGLIGDSFAGGFNFQIVVWLWILIIAANPSFEWTTFAIPQVVLCAIVQRSIVCFLGQLRKGTTCCVIAIIFHLSSC